MSDNKLVLMAVGDMMLGEHPLFLRRGVKSMMIQKSSPYPFEHVANILKEADVVFGNLECSLSRGKTPEWRSAFSATPDSVHALKDTAFNILSLANNHVMENGKQAVIETMKILDDHNISYVGIGKDKSSIRNPVIVQIRNIKLAFLAYSLSPPLSSAPMPRANDLYANGDLPEIKRDIRTAKEKQADLIIVSLHWGHEFIDTPSPLQVKFARELIESGVNIIIGHHPHVLQGFESYKGGLIVYSLGNFIFDIARSPKVKESVIMKCSVSKSQINDIEFIPVFINQHFQPELVDGQDAERIRQRISRLSFTVEDLECEQKQICYDISVQHIQRQTRRWLLIFVLKNLGSFSFPTFLILVWDRLRKIARGLIRVMKKSA